jgi:hypothetical protein
MVRGCCLLVVRNEWPDRLMVVRTVHCEVRLLAVTLQPLMDVMVCADSGVRRVQESRVTRTTAVHESECHILEEEGCDRV